MVYLLFSEKVPLLVKNIDTQNHVHIYKTSKRFGVRHLQALLMFGGICFGYFLRVNISAAIVPMTQPSISGSAFYNWDTSQKSLILSSFFWGYVLAQLPASLLAKRYGGRKVFGGATVVSATATLLHPLAAAAGGWKLVCGLRALVGLTQGVVYPCIHTLLAQWAPRTERGFLATSVYSGAQFGTAIILATSGDIFDSSIGWPGIFYISGGIALIWSVIFLFCGADAPGKSKMISSVERKYIEELTGSHSENENLSVPWKSLFTSLPFYGLITAQCGFTWGFYTLLTEIPTYMSNVLQLNVKANAFLSALPYFVMGIICLIISPISDWVINHGYLNVTTSRKLFNSIGQWVPMACLIALGYMSANEKTLAVTLLTIGVGFNAASFCGYLVNHMDLSPNFAGPMMGISNCISNLLSACAPVVVGLIVIDEKDSSQWRLVFFITAAVYLICNATFIFLGSATIQTWNYRSLPNNTVVSTSNAEIVSDLIVTKI